MSNNILDSLQDGGVLSKDSHDKISAAIPENVKENMWSMLSEDSQEKLMSMINQYKELNDEEKEEFRKDALGVFRNSINKAMNNPSLYMKLWFWHSYILFFVALALVFVLLVFFVYKLFKCLQEREQKREEKKKSKQLKKKK